MATTNLLNLSGSVVIPVEYFLHYPLPGAAWAMDRFIPSSREPQIWSRNYHGSQGRRRSMGQSKESADTQDQGASCYRRGVTLRAEDLLADSESKFGVTNRVLPANHLTVRAGDQRRVVIGGSATELAQCERPRAVLRRSSEGATFPRGRGKSTSNSSSDAGDEPSPSDSSSRSSSTCGTTSSSSSESGCNADSETCNYCRLLESTEEKDSSSSDADRSSSSPSPPKLSGSCRRLTRALSEDCNPPSRPVRRTSPGEYLRYKRDQMEKLRKEQLKESPRKQGRIFHRWDSDPRLSRRRYREHDSPSKAACYASPTRNRSRKGSGPKEEMTVPADARTERSTLGRDLAERRSRSRERRPDVVWSAEEAAPFLQRRGSFRCTVCDCDIPFTNCVLCSAEAKVGFVAECGPAGEVFVDELDVITLNSDDLLVETEIVPLVETPACHDQISSTEKELEEFYDKPTPVETPPLPAVPSTPGDRRSQWTSRGATHKSFNQDERRSATDRRSSLRKYYSEPAPPRNEAHQQAEGCSTRQPVDAVERREASSAASSKASYHVAKDSPQKEPANSCDLCGKKAEKEELPEKPMGRTLSPEVKVQDKSPRRSPLYLKPEFDFEPEIIHKANPLVDEADVDLVPAAAAAFRRLSEEEFISTLNIHEAAKKGDLHVVKLLTKKDPKQMETVDERGWTPIHLAAAHGHAEVVKYLAMEGAHLAALDPSSYTAIHLAAMNGHNSCLEVLLPLGVDVDFITSEGFTPLHLAVMNNHLECIQTLLQWGASLDKKDALGRGIHDMVEEYNLQDVAALLRRFHKQLHNFKHVLDMMKREGRNSADIPREFMDILASIAEESGTE